LCPFCGGIGRSIALFVREEKHVAICGDLDECSDSSCEGRARFVGGSREDGGGVAIHVDHVGARTIVGNECEFLLNLGLCLLEERSNLTVSFWEIVAASVDGITLRSWLEEGKVNDKNLSRTRLCTWDVQEVDMILSECHDRIIPGCCE